MPVTFPCSVDPGSSGPAMDFLGGIVDLGNAFVEKQVAKRNPAKADTPTVQPAKLEHLYGCAACNFSEAGCRSCWDSPFATRPAARARPDDYHWQHDLPDAPTFRPTAAEFNDPFAYLASIAAEAAAGGIALIIPPPEWQPPIQMLDQTTGQLRKDFTVPVRIQPTHLLCRRYPTPAGAPPESPGSAQPGAGGKGKKASERLTMKFGPAGDEQAAAADDDNGSEQDGDAAAAAAPPRPRQKQVHPVTGRCSKSSMQQQQAAVAAAAAAIEAGEPLPTAGGGGSDDEDGGDANNNPADADAAAAAAAAADGQFGYEHLEEPLSLADFHRYAEWAKRRHFNGPLMTGLSKRQQQAADAAAAAAAGSTSGRGSAAAAAASGASALPVSVASNAWRCHPVTPAAKAARGLSCKPLPGQGGGGSGGRSGGRGGGEEWREPDILEVEAEFWRIVEAAEDQVEALYGQDVDTATYSSAFPTIKELAVEEARQLLKPGPGRLQHQKLKKLLGQQQQQPAAAPAAAGNGSGPAAGGGGGEALVDQEPAMAFPMCGCGKCQLCNLRSYTCHPWNINNIPQATGSVLRFVREDVGGKPITGLMVPWLYVGSCFSAFAWHIEDHGLYSVNYNHMGAPKVWYGVPATAAAALEACMRDGLPHLFERDRLLLHKLVTMMSPNELKRRGVPVCRAVQVPGSFVVTFPDAYHAGFNSGFNVAEAVNFAAPNWLPFGSSSVVRYRNESRYMTFSHDQMLINVVRDAAAAAARDAAAAAAAAAAPPALPAPDQQQQAPGSGAKPPRARRQQQQQRSKSLKALAADTAAAAAARAAAEAALLQPRPLFGLRAQFAAGLEATLADLAAAEVTAIEQHWQQKQQQQHQGGGWPAAVACVSDDEEDGDEHAGVRFVAPPTGLTTAPLPAVALSSSVTDSSFWWDWHGERSWQEAAQLADESAALASQLRRQQQQQQQEGEQQQQQHEHHGCQQGEQQQQHHLAAASAQHHAGQRERVFTMRGASAGPGAAAAAAAAASGGSAGVVGRAARALVAASFGVGSVQPSAAESKAAAAAAAAADGEEGGGQQQQLQGPEAVVSALVAYIMALADTRRTQLLLQPPRPGLAAAAVGELALRLELEQQRQAAFCLRAGISAVSLMTGTAAAVDPASGVHVNTQGVECAACGGDLTLAAVVSAADPGRAVCPAHTGDLDGSRSSWRLLLRYAPGQLDRLLAAGLALVPGAAQAVVDSRRRYSWVVAGRFSGGALLRKVKEQQEEEKAGAVVAVKQEADGVGGAGGVRQPRPLVPVKLLGRLYEPDELSRKLFEDLEAAAGADASSSGASGGGGSSDDYEADGGGSSSGSEGEEEQEEEEQSARRPQHKRAKAAAAAAAGSDASGGDGSSGSWWAAELEGGEDSFGFYTFGSGGRAGASSDGGGGDTSDDDFRPTVGRRKRRRAPAAPRSRKRAAAGAGAAAAAVQAG